MKKGIVLLITLFFITAISVLVLKNIDDTDTFLERQNYVLNNTQLLISIKNTQEQIETILAKNEKDYIENILGTEGISFPIVIHELTITSTLTNYDRVDVNIIKKEDSKIFKELFDEYNIFDYGIFEDIYNLKLQTKDTNEKSIDTNKQLDDIINDFIIKTENHQIEKIRKKIGFINNAKYELNIDAQYLGTNTKAYYILNEKGEVLYFDISLI